MPQRNVEGTDDFEKVEWGLDLLGEFDGLEVIITDGSKFISGILNWFTAELNSQAFLQEPLQVSDDLKRRLPGAKAWLRKDSILSQLGDVMVALPWGISVISREKSKIVKIEWDKASWLAP